MNIDLDNLTIEKTRELLSSKKISAVFLVKHFLEKIKKVNPEYHIFLETYSDVLDQAERADKDIAAGIHKPLLGVPIALKDNILVRGQIASAGSKILQNYRATFDATVVKKLKNAGAIILGRVNMDEFAMGSSTESSVYGVTKNPLDRTRVPGGSSGGSAAAVSADLAVFTLGSDTGGSIRQPSAFCGVVGFKPTYGSVSRHGLMAMGSSLDVIGPIAKNVADIKTIFEVISGRDDYDSTSIDIQKDNQKKGKKVADMSDFFASIGNLKPEVIENYQKGLEHFKKLGYEIIKPKTDLSPLKYALPTYYIIMPAEVSANLARFDGIRYGFSNGGKDLLSVYKMSKGEGFGKEVRRRIILGTYVLSSGYYDAYYGKAQNVRNSIKETYKKLLGEVDIVALPTTPSPAFKIGEKTSNPVDMYLEDIFTVTANMIGAPAISVPFGSVNIEGKDLPLGIQLMAGIGEDYFLLDVAEIFSQ